MPHLRKQLNFEAKDLWYLVGLIATDGNLSPSGRHIDITAKERIFLELIKQKFGFENKIGSKKHGKGMVHYRIQIGNKGFYEFLMSVGLMPNKSLILGELKIPAEWFADFFRGVIDGDGSIRKWIHRTNRHEQWSLKISSAAPIFIQWLKQAAETSFSAKGRIHREKTGVFNLKFGKLAAKRILDICYYEGCLSLDRKARLARSCSMTKSAWSTSKTLVNVA